MLIGIPVFNEAERAAFEKTPWPVPFKEDGSSLVEEWQRHIETFKKLKLNRQSREIVVQFDIT